MHPTLIDHPPSRDKEATKDFRILLRLVGAIQIVVGLLYIWLPREGASE